MSAPVGVGEPRVTELAVDSSESALAEAGRDFGGLARGTVTAVVAPRSASEVQAAVRSAVASGEKLTPRGQGMSQSGQSVPRNGKSLDLRRLDHVGEPNTVEGTISVGPGATFRQVLARLAPRGSGVPEAKSRGIRADDQPRRRSCVLRPAARAVRLTARGSRRSLAR